MSVYKRPGSRYWWFKFYFDGVLFQQSSRCKNKRDAETVESAYRTQLALGKVGIHPKKKPITFKQAAEEFLEIINVTHARKTDTLQRLHQNVKPLVRYFGNKRVDQIDQADGERYLIERSKEISRTTKKPVTRDTVNLEFAALRRILSRLVADGTLADNPLKNIKRLQENDRRFHVLSEDEERRYLMAAPQPLQDVAALMLETGARPTEIFNLTRQRVDLAAGYFQVVDGKTKSSNRKVWLSETAAEIIRRRMEVFRGDHLFPQRGQDGNPPIYTLSMQHLVTRKRAELPEHFRLYDCRHTFASRQLESGLDLLTLAALLGHSNLNQVQVYAHPSEERKRNAVMNRKDQAKAAQ